MNVFITADNIISPLGNTSAANFEQLRNEVSGIREHHLPAFSPVPFYAGLFEENAELLPGGNSGDYTKFEQLLIASVGQVLKDNPVDTSSPRTGLIISTTKGNISLLETDPGNADLASRVALHHSAKLVAGHFGFTAKPVVVSNACISGLLAMLTGMRMIRSSQYDDVVVTGGDVISRFILSGFQSFQAVSDSVCKPFDAARNGINLGEAAATVILSRQSKSSEDIRLMGGSVSNDANHISGPSRTGEELFQAIGHALQDAGIPATDIDFISAHGTATIYNDEMEAKAINLAGLQQVPVNSLKAYYGHTLGAAGLVESVIAAHSLQKGIILSSLGYNESGVTQPLNICTKLQPAVLNNCLKTASGFGGCNAALVFSKQ